VSVHLEIAAGIRALPSLLSGVTLQAGSYVTTGLGFSEGPARYLAQALRDNESLPQPTSARFVPVSSFGRVPPKADHLVVFSHALCPNAHVPFETRDQYKSVTLVTGSRSAEGEPSPWAEKQRARELALRTLEAGGVRVLYVSGPEEQGALLRTRSPAIATAAAYLLSGGRAQASDLAQAYERAHVGLARADMPPALATTPTLAVVIVSGDQQDYYQGLAQKILEGVGVHATMADCIHFVHGTLQATYERDCRYVVLCNAESSEDLRQRFETMLARKPGAILSLRSALPGAEAFFDFDAELNLWVQTLRQTQGLERNSADWPASGIDAPLYNVRSLRDGLP
jgi:hypothetical protein